MISVNPDTGLKEMLDKVMDYTLLIKNFQIKELLTTDPDSLDKGRGVSRPRSRL